MLRVLICGDRYWTGHRLIDNVISILKANHGNDIAIIHGACSGVDAIAGQVATKYQLTVWSEPAKWDVYGNAAGPIRNALMICRYKPNLVVAFHANLKESKGTRDMLEKADNFDIPTLIINRTSHLQLLVNAKTKIWGDSAHSSVPGQEGA
jgi:hypothetical protein